MIFSKRFYLFIAVFTLGSFIVKSQETPIGYWDSFLPYNSSVGVVTDGNTLYTICVQPFFTYNPSQNATEPYSKVNGMSDIGMQCVAYDMATSTTVLVYADGNIDLFKNNTFYNIPDFKIKTIAGNKAVNQVYCENGIAYLSTSVGILVIDLTTYNINETYQFIVNNQNLPVYGFTGNDSNFYAITQHGLYRASKNNTQLQNFEVWQNIDSTDAFNYIASVNNTLFLANSQSVYALTNNTVHRVYSCPLGPADIFTYHKNRGQGYTTITQTETNDTTVIEHIDGGTTGLLISEFRPNQYNGDIRVMDTTFKFIDSCTNLGQPLQAVQLLDNSIWIADGYYGLEKRTTSDLHIPSGPPDPNAYDMYVNNKNLWIAHGGINDALGPTGDFHCASNFNNGKWTNYERYIYPPFDTVTNAVAIVKDESNGTIYIGSYTQGLRIINADGTDQYVDNIAIFDGSIAIFYDNQRQVAGLALDQSKNLWVTLAYSKHELYVRNAADSLWYKFFVPGNLNGGPVLVDNNGLVWFVCLGGGGVVAYNTNNTISTLTDDTYFHLTTGVGTGNLPSDNVFCIAKDINNNIWIGTDNGIGIVSNCSVDSGQAAVCDAVLPIVQYDQFAGYLFAGNNVRTIAVDGANRKWVGTDDGVWLLSADASTIIYRFTVDNSPLPSNNIRKISIDPVTGDVYIGTDQGLVSYRGTATSGGDSTGKVVIFPNPVPKGYTGTIAIKGLASNSDVRITDVNGQLVYRTTALGGQAVWSGKDYTGRRPETGVYLVFASSSDGSQTYAGKIVFIN